MISLQYRNTFAWAHWRDPLMQRQGKNLQEEEEEEEEEAEEEEEEEEKFWKML